MTPPGWRAKSPRMRPIAESEPSALPDSLGVRFTCTSRRPTHNGLHHPACQHCESLQPIVLGPSPKMPRTIGFSVPARILGCEVSQANAPGRFGGARRSATSDGPRARDLRLDLDPVDRRAHRGACPREIVHPHERSIPVGAMPGATPVKSEVLAEAARPPHRLPRRRTPTIEIAARSTCGETPGSPRRREVSRAAT